MDRKIIIGGIIGLVLVGGVTGWFFVRSLQKDSAVSPMPQGEVSTPLLPSKTLKAYESEAGFTFQYPDDVTVSAKDIDDSATYADVEISSTKASGKLTFKAVDTKLPSLASWLKENKKDLSNAKDITLGDLAAKEIVSDGTIKSVALDQGVLFTIAVEGSEQEEFWKSVYETLLSTFAFVQAETLQGSSGSSSGAGADVIFEGEEVIE